MSARSAEPAACRHATPATRHRSAGTGTTRGARSLLAAALTATLLGACTPYRLSGTVGGFRDSILQAGEALDAGLVNLRSDIVAERTTRAVATRGRVNVPGHCATVQRVDATNRPFPPCIAVVAADTRPIEMSAQAGAAEARRKMAVLMRYAAGLAALTDARDSQAIASATTQLAGAASMLALANAPVGDPVATAAGATAAAAVGLAGTTARIALDLERSLVLRRTVNATDAHVRVLAISLGTYFETLRAERLRLVFTDARFQSDRIATADPFAFAGAFSAIQGRLDVADALRAADGAATGRAIANAHARLVAAANDDAAGAAEFAAAVGQLADATTTLRRALAAQTAAESAARAATRR